MKVVDSQKADIVILEFEYKGAETPKLVSKAVKNPASFLKRLIKPADSFKSPETEFEYPDAYQKTGDNAWGMKGHMTILATGYHTLGHITKLAPAHHYISTLVTLNSIKTL